jgi:hypothetical protein
MFTPELAIFFLATIPMSNHVYDGQWSRTCEVVEDGAPSRQRQNNIERASQVIAHAEIIYTSVQVEASFAQAKQSRNNIQ